MGGKRPGGGGLSEAERPGRPEAAVRSLPLARAVLEAWRRDYNEKRPHSKVGWMTVFRSAAAPGSRDLDPFPVDGMAFPPQQSVQATVAEMPSSWARVFSHSRNASSPARTP